MKEKGLLVANVVMFLFAILLLGSLQTSLWLQIFGNFPGPALWIPCLIYIALFRSPLESIIFSYLAGIALSTMSAMPEGLMMILCLALVLSAQLFKQRIYWAGSSYIMMTCGLASLMFNLYHWIATFILGDTPMTSPQVMDWLIQALLTPLVAPPLFPVFQWIDRFTQREPPTEISAQIS